MGAELRAQMEVWVGGHCEPIFSIRIPYRFCCCWLPVKAEKITVVLSRAALPAAERLIPLLSPELPCAARGNLNADARRVPKIGTRTVARTLEGSRW